MSLCSIEQATKPYSVGILAVNLIGLPPVVIMRDNSFND
jgi:hypothetical protein